MMCPAGFDFSPDYDLITFLDDVKELMVYLFPAAIGYMLWRIFVTNRMAPRGGVLSLGLDETSATHSELYGRKISGWKLALYAVTSVLTFNLGLLAFDVYYYLADLVSSLLA